MWVLYVHTHTHPFNGPLSRTTRVSRYQKSTTNLDFTEARDSEWQWHQLGHIQVCTLLQTDNHASPHHSVFSGQMLFQLPNQQRQSTGGQISSICNVIILMLSLKFTCVAYSSKALVQWSQFADLWPCMIFHCYCCIDDINKLQLLYCSHLLLLSSEVIPVSY